MPPLNLLIKPASSLCNMRCKYCFYGDVSERRSFDSFGMMSENTLETLVKRAFEYADDRLCFAFQGGEPTLAGIDFYRKLIDLEKQYNTKNIAVSNSIQTNGYLIDDEWAEFFAKNGFLVGLSLDGTKEAHDSIRIDAAGKGTFDRVSAAAAVLEKHHVEFNILCVVNNFVARYPKKVYENLKKYRYLQFIACLDPFDGEKQIYSLKEDRYASFLKQTFDLYYRDIMSGNYVSIRNFDNYINILMGKHPESCAMSGFCTCYGVVEGDGSVYPCDFYVLDQWKLGNVNQNSIEEMLSSTTAKHFVEASLQVSQSCRACRYYPLCRGGCRRDREPFEGDMPPLNRHCKAYREFFEYSIDRMLEIAKALGAN